MANSNVKYAWLAAYEMKYPKTWTVQEGSSHSWTYVKQMILRADTYIYDECRVAFFQSASEPQEVLVAPMYLVLTRVKLAPCGLEREATNQHQTLGDLSLFLVQIIQAWGHIYKMVTSYLASMEWVYIYKKFVFQLFQNCLESKCTVQKSLFHYY